jgi:hypothetical protein
VLTTNSQCHSMQEPRLCCHIPTTDESLGPIANDFSALAARYKTCPASCRTYRPCQQQPFLRSRVSSYPTILRRTSESRRYIRDMKLIHACSLAVSVSSSIVAANPLRVTVTIDDKPNAPAALTAALQPVEWQNCGNPWDVFQLNNITITPNPPIS